MQEGQIVASCGHTIALEWFASDDSTGVLIDYDKEGHKGVSVGVYCPQCKAEMRAAFARGLRYARRYKLLEGIECACGEDDCDYFG